MNGGSGIGDVGSPFACRRWPSRMVSDIVNVCSGPPGPCFHGRNGSLYSLCDVDLGSTVRSFKNEGDGSDVDSAGVGSAASATGSSKNCCSSSSVGGKVFSEAEAECALGRTPREEATVLGATKAEVATELDLINPEVGDCESFCGGGLSWMGAGMGSH